MFFWKNCYYLSVEKINKKRNLLGIVAIFAIACLFCFQVFWGSVFVFAADSIDEIENKIEKEEAEKAKLEQELGSIQSSVNSTQYEIQKTENLIKQAEDKIERSKKELEIASERISLQRESLRGLLQEFY